MTYSLLDRIVYRLTARRWNRLISNVLFRHTKRSEWSAHLSSEQFHKLAAEFDPTQKARWEAIGTDGRLVFSEDISLKQKGGSCR